MNIKEYRETLRKKDARWKEAAYYRNQAELKADFEEAVKLLIDCYEDNEDRSGYDNVKHFIEKAYKMKWEEIREKL